MAYDNSNTGILSKNESMREGKDDPGYTGSINVGGVEYWLSAWVNVGKEGGKMEGKKFFRLTVKPKSATTTKQAKRPAAQDDSDFPF